MLTKTDKQYIEDLLNARLVTFKREMFEGLDDHFAKQNEQLAKQNSDVMGALQKIQEEMTVMTYQRVEDHDTLDDHETRICTLEANVAFA